MMMPCRSPASFLLLVSLFLPSAVWADSTSEPPRIDADFPGGNIRLRKIAGDTVCIEQELRDTTDWWFWWNFRVRGAAGRELTFRFERPSPIGVRGPAVSLDGGRSWSWLGASSVDGPSFAYSFPPTASEVRFCFAIPYQQADLDRFLARFAESDDLEVKALCRTRRRRAVPLLRVGDESTAKHRVLLTARHHACEALASYVLDGILEVVLGKGEEGEWFRRSVDLLAAPFMDLDGVEAGDQGKLRAPRDHNRDYAGESIHPSVRALRELVPRWSKGKLRVAIDLHCPWIRGARNEVIYMVGGPDQEIWRETEALGSILEEVQTGPLRYRARDNLAFGREWNTGRNYAQGKSFSRWASGLEGVRLATTIEFPYANVTGEEVTVDGARAFGRDLARALRRYLEGL